MIMASFLEPNFSRKDIESSNILSSDDIPTMTSNQVEDTSTNCRKSVSFSGISWIKEKATEDDEKKAKGENEFNTVQQQQHEQEDASVVVFCDESTGLLSSQQQHKHQMDTSLSWDSQDDSTTNYDTLTASWRPTSSFSSFSNNDNKNNKQMQSQGATISPKKIPPIPPPYPIQKPRTTSVTFEDPPHSRERFYSCENQSSTNDQRERFYSCSDDLEKAIQNSENEDLEHPKTTKRNGKVLWQRVYKHLDTLVLKSKWSSVLDDNSDDYGDEALLSGSHGEGVSEEAAMNGHGRKEKNSSCNNTQGKERLEKKVQQTVETPLYTCIVAIIIYLSFSILAYSFVFEKWPIVDSLYFAVVTFTTIGYGDLSPSSNTSKIFTCFYALIGIVSLGIALGVLGSNVIESQVSAIDSAQRMSQYYTLNLFGVASRVGKIKGKHHLQHYYHDDDHGGAHTDDLDEETLLRVDINGNGEEQQDDKRLKRQKQKRGGETKKEEHGSSNDDRRDRRIGIPPLILVVLRIFILSFLSSFLIGSEQEWGWVDTLYYFTISASTIGYGDLIPSSTQSRALAVFVIPIMVACIGEFLHELSSSIIERRQARYRRALFEQHNFQMCDLEAMAGGDGGSSKSSSVTREDFVAFMLIAMKKVDEELIHELHSQFERLDVDKSGTLTRADLIAVARRKLKSTKRKLQLARYKRQLLSKSQHQLRRHSLWRAFQKPSSSSPSYDWQESLAMISDEDTESTRSKTGLDASGNKKQSE